MYVRTRNRSTRDTTTETLRIFISIAFSYDREKVSLSRKEIICKSYIYTTIASDLANSARIFYSKMFTKAVDLRN